MARSRESLRKHGEKMKDRGAKLLETGVRMTGTGVEEALKATAAPFYFTSHFIEGTVLPATNALLEINRDTTESLSALLAGKRRPTDVARDITSRVWAGSRYSRLMNKLGRQLFGSARYEGEVLLSENSHFRLSYLPPKPGAPDTGAALFHAGGFIPYGDGIFRLLPEANLFGHFLERGVAVYAMELKPREQVKRFGSLTMERLLDMMDDMSQVAFEHNRRRKMCIEGYCGATMPMMSFLAAKPRAADERFGMVLTMVAPIDATRCTLFHEMQKYTPQSITLMHFALSKLMGGYVRGFNLWAGLDTALVNVFPKTPFGRFVAGWRNKEYARVRTIADLTPEQRIELTGAYWISVENCMRFPIPVDILKFQNRLFSRGLGPNGEIPVTYRGRPLSLRTLRDETDLQIVGIYGARDRMIPNATGLLLTKVMGDRYRHIVHESAGHVSYIFSTSMWKPDNPRAFDPNPVDLLLAQNRY